MGKVELKFEVDAELVERLETAGLDPAKAAEAGMRIAASSGRVPFWLDLSGSARQKAGDPEGAERRAQEWAERNKDAIAEFNQRVEERGLLSDYEPFKPRWMR